MKRAFVFLLFVLGLMHNSFPQEVKCENFCVTSIEFNSENQLVVTVQFNGEGTEFINYPYVSSILDAEGNEIATGDMYYFGQIVNTSQEYFVSTSVVPPFPTDFDGTIIFNYDTVFCELPYSCLTGISNNIPVALNTYVYPNPVDDELHIIRDSDQKNLPWFIMNETGKILISGILQENAETIDMSAIPAGLYFLQFHGKEKRIFKIIKIKG